MIDRKRTQRERLMDVLGDYQRHDNYELMMKVGISFDQRKNEMQREGLILVERTHDEGNVAHQWYRLIADYRTCPTSVEADGQLVAQI